MSECDDGLGEGDGRGRKLMKMRTFGRGLVLVCIAWSLEVVVGP